MMVLFEGASGQECALDALDVRAVFPAVAKGADAPGAIPVLGQSVVHSASSQHGIVVKGSAREVLEKVNAARREMFALQASAAKGSAILS